jgi:hypothetical protein
VCEHVFVRWDEQTVEQEEESRLPGFAEDGIVRTFDAPEALGIRFHEVRAKSVLNHVPGGRFGFNWTINLYRGCTHACRLATASPAVPTSTSTSTPGATSSAR